MTEADVQPVYGIALQPVCDRNLKHVADKLLYRSSPNATVAVIDDPMQATMRSFTSAVYECGIERLVGERQLLFTAPLEWVEKAVVFQLPAERLVAELPASAFAADLDPKVLLSLREQGYTIAIDADICDSIPESAAAAANLVKIDIRRPDADRLLQRLRRDGRRFMATFVEDRDALARAREAGCDWYQGFLFSPPFLVKDSSRKRFGNRQVELKILAELSAKEMDVERLESVLAQHPDFCLMLLKQVNSVSHHRSERRIDSLRECIVILGHDRIRAIATMLLLSHHDEVKEIQIRALLTRAALARGIARRIRSLDPEQAFTAALFSRLGGVEQLSMEELLEGMPFSLSIRNALVSRDGEMGRLLSLLDSFERGELQHLSPVVVATLNQDYLQALAWTEQSLLKTQR